MKTFSDQVINFFKLAISLTLNFLQQTYKSKTDMILHKNISWIISISKKKKAYFSGITSLLVTK